MGAYESKMLKPSAKEQNVKAGCPDSASNSWKHESTTHESFVPPSMPVRSMPDTSLYTVAMTALSRLTNNYVL